MLIFNTTESLKTAYLNAHGQRKCCKFPTAGFFFNISFCLHNCQTNGITSHVPSYAKTKRFHTRLVKKILLFATLWLTV